jgi:hypothetical protein
MAYRALTPAEQARFDPMITGFNPADMYAVDHIRRVLATFPGVFSGIGEFSIHKEFVSAKIAGETASLTNPALDRILDFAGEAGLVVILHNDIDMPFAKTDSEPVYLTQMKALLRRHANTTIIWAHVGLGRIVHPVQVSAEAAERAATHVGIVEDILTDPAFAHVNFDISWDEVAKYAVATPESIARVAAMLNRYPTASCSAPTRWRRPVRRLLRGVRHVGAGVAPAHARGSLKVARATTSASSTKGGGGARWEQARRNPRQARSIIMRRIDGPARFVLAGDGTARGGPGTAQRRSARLQASRVPAAVRRHASAPEPSQLRDLRLRHARHRPRLQDDHPELVRHDAPDKLPSFEKQFGEDSNTFAGVRQSRLGVKSVDARPPWSDLKTIFEFELFGPASTRDRPRSAAARLRRVGTSAPARRGARSWTRRVPEHARILGPDGHGALPQRPVRYSAVDNGRIS